MRDDLVQQLAEVISDAIAAGAGESHSPVNAVARAVLASGLVVPTSDVHGLAHRLQVRGGCDPVREASDAWYACAEELRALTERGPT